jgi:hypothetical protein
MTVPKPPLKIDGKTIPRQTMTRDFSLFKYNKKEGLSQSHNNSEISPP